VSGQLRLAVPCIEEQMCYNCAMTKDQVKEILERVLTWPPERQADIAHVAELMEEQDSSTYQITDEQLAEVRRRRAENNPKTLTLDEWDRRLRRFGV
jgi:hypothetical protein